jgi:hypothetical protein
MIMFVANKIFSTVIPAHPKGTSCGAQTGIQCRCVSWIKTLGPRLRGDDRNK